MNLMLVWRRTVSAYCSQSKFQMCHNHFQNMRSLIMELLVSLVVDTGNMPGGGSSMESQASRAQF